MGDASVCSVFTPDPRLCKISAEMDQPEFLVILVVLVVAAVIYLFFPK